METAIRNNWTNEEIAALFDLPFFELLYAAHTVHKQYFKEHTVQLSTLLSIKTGSCPEDCAYCPQSAHFKTEINKHPLMDIEKIKEMALKAKERGATRFCMGAAWRSPPKKEMPKLQEIIREVKSLGMETCITLGMLNEEQAQGLAEAGLDYYNHNIDTSPEYYNEIITTRNFQDRLDTLENVRKAGMNVCCGGIMGLGETRQDRISFLKALANLSKHPESLPINKLIRVKGTPLGEAEELDNLEFIRVIAVARIMMPESTLRLSAGRVSMTDEMQAWCFFAGAGSIHYGEEKLLTTPNPDADHDLQLLKRLGLKPLQPSETLQTC